MNKSPVPKPFKLKQWLTLPEAVRHLSGVCGGEVTEANILRLALDGHLTLSINFVTPVLARCGRIVGYEDVEWEEFPPSIKSGVYSRYIKNLQLDDDRFLDFDDEVIRIRGVWDLPMIGNEKLYVEHQFQNLLGVSAVIDLNRRLDMKGNFVQAHDGRVYQLQMLYDDPEIVAGLFAPLRLTSHIVENTTNIAKKEERDINSFIDKSLTEDVRMFCPAWLRQDNSLLVVRDEVLIEFEELIVGNKRENNVAMHPSKPVMPTFQRSRDYNECIVEVIKDFIEATNYAPTTVDEVMSRMKYKPPMGIRIEFRDNNVSIEGGTPKPIKNLERAIKRQLEKLKNQL